jgi:hypothetical protein
MYPVLVVGGGLTTVAWDFRSIILRQLGLSSMTAMTNAVRRDRRSDGNNDDLPVACSRGSSPNQGREQEVDRIERIELPELGSGAEDAIRPVVVQDEGVKLEQPEPVKYRDRDRDRDRDGKYGLEVDVERQGQVKGQGVRQRQTHARQEKKTGTFPSTQDLTNPEEVAQVMVKEEIHTLPAKTAATIFVLFVTLVVTFVVLKSTLRSPSREMSLFTK